MKALTVNETLKFERGLDPKDAMNVGDMPSRRFKQFEAYYNFIKASDKFIVDAYPSFSDTFWVFDFKAKETIGPYCHYCTNDRHFGEHGHFNMEYDRYTDKFFIEFHNNGDVEYIHSLKDIKDYLGLNHIKESNFERGLDPKKAMNVGKEAMDRKIIEETDWHLPLDIIEQNFNIIEVSEYKGNPILLLKSQYDEDGDGKIYVALTTKTRSDYYKSSKDAFADLKKYIDMYVKRKN